MQLVSFQSGLKIQCIIWDERYSIYLYKYGWRQSIIYSK